MGIFAKKINKKNSDIGIGVDVGNYSVKVAQIRQKDTVFELENFGYAKIDTGESRKGVVDAVKQACQHAKLSSRSVNAAIAPDGVIIRYLVLPEMNNDDLKKAMGFEIERYVPFSGSEAISDYIVLSEHPDTSNMKVLLVAARKKVVEKRVGVLRDAGLDPMVITIDSVVLKNIFQVNYPEKNTKTVGLLNIGSKVSNINIVRESVSYFMRDVQLGGDSITQVLKEKLEMSPDEAEKLKCDLTLDDKEKFKIIEPVLGNLLNEIYLSFDYYESEFSMVVDEVIISGGTAELGWLVRFLKENLNREVTILDPFKKITVAASVSSDMLKTTSSSAVVACGLALETFN